jgi:nicotinamidase-related amidase
MRHEGFHGRAGLGRRPALVVIDVNRGFTDPASPLVCELDDVVAAIRRLLDGFRAAGLPVAFTTVAYDDAGKRAASVFIDKVPALLTLEAGYRVLVPRDAVGDRNPDAHEANLYDIDTKYGDVVTTDDVLDGIAGAT